MWAILTNPAKSGGRWTPEEFFATGQHDVDDVMRKVNRLALPSKRGAVLDFGCGVGRVTQALSVHFDRATGVDISPTMLDLARKYNRCGERCQFVWNTQPH
ncbi:MAG: class I SAM-dependent methyltransferase, partial [Bryobacteraceae bacterium]